MSEQVYTTPDTLNGQTLKGLVGQYGGNFDILSKMTGLGADTPLTSGQAIRINSVPGINFSSSTEGQLLSKYFTPTTEEALATAGRQKAIAPAVASYEQSIPEIQNTYKAEQDRLAAQKDPLSARYDLLLKNLTGRISTDTTREFAKRGISTQSGVFDNTLTERINPVTQDIGLSKEADLRAIDDQISKLTGMQVGDIRNVRQAIANLQAGAGNAGIDDAFQYRQLNQNQNQFEAGQNLQRELNKQPDADPYKLIGEGGVLYDTRTGKPAYENVKDFKSTNNNANGAWE